MKNLSKIIALVLLLATLASCKQQQARMPVSRSSGTFMKESVIRNKKLVASEEAKIDSIIKNPIIMQNILIRILLLVQLVKWCIISLLF